MFATIIVVLLMGILELKIVKCLQVHDTVANEIRLYESMPSKTWASTVFFFGHVNGRNAPPKHSNLTSR